VEVVDDEDDIIFLRRRRLSAERERTNERAQKSEEKNNSSLFSFEDVFFYGTSFRAERRLFALRGAVQRAPGERVRAGRRV
jgi:hypothetical protein